MQLGIAGTYEYFTQLQMIRRDIIYLYDELSNYAGLMGDLYWGTVYSLPYWDYIAMEFPQCDYPEFLRDGCIVMVTTMAWDILDGSGDYIRDKIPQCLSSLAAVCANDDKTSQLILCASKTLETARDRIDCGQEIIDMANWIFENYVRHYFQTVADDLLAASKNRSSSPAS